MKGLMKMIKETAKAHTRMPLVQCILATMSIANAKGTAYISSTMAMYMKV